jgi:glutamate N-acetyltransferase/amino-acid N-acetyltransferase
MQVLPTPNCVLQITVDGDTSTNDTVIGLASGKSGAPLISDASSADGKTLEAALTALLQVG